MAAWPLQRQKHLGPVFRIPSERTTVLAARFLIIAKDFDLMCASSHRLSMNSAMHEEPSQGKWDQGALGDERTR